MKHLDRAPVRFLALAAFAASAAALAAPAPVQNLPLPTTLQDFHQPGTQPNSLVQVIEESINCTGCHSGYDPAQEPYSRWTASMMAQATRDPVFHAALAIANQDASQAGELCLRCHAPGAWLDGRSTPADGSALTQALGDFDGVTCHLCHRSVDPVYDPSQNPQIDRRILDALAEIPITPSNGQYVIDPTDVRRGPFDLGPNFYFHDWRQSPFHRESLLCANCHEVSNPTLSKQLDGSYQLNATNAPHPTQDKHDEFPIERTYSEWDESAYAQVPIQTIDASYPSGRFGGNKTAVSTCQDCHMPDTHGTGCIPSLAVAVRDDLPQHNFNGTNSWVLDAVRSLYPDSETALNNLSVADAHGRNDEMQHRAADLAAWTNAGQLIVRIANQTGHKLPTGYPEGRRMWINVQFKDALDQVIAERGAYDLGTATLTTNDTKVYEAKLGIDAQQSVATGLPAGESFHFVLNNTILSDNRIPPRGFTNAAFDAAQVKPVAYAYGEEQYWDETSYTIPLGAVKAVVTTYHQTSSREYMEFLLNTNTTNGAGTIAYNQWVMHGKSAPVQMQTTTVDFVVPSCPPPIPYGLAKTLSNGRTPVLTWSGTPSLTQQNFVMEVKNGLPRSTGVLRSSPTTNSVPFQGGTLYLGGTRVDVANFQLNQQGQASIPILVTPLMIGTQVNYQAFFRDRNAPLQLALTNAVHVTFCQ
jgi:hypothetical protein